MSRSTPTTTSSATSPHRPTPRPGRWATAALPSAALATTLLLAGCGQSSGTAGAAPGTGGTGPDGSPVPGGTLTVAVASDAGCVDPQQVGTNDGIYSARQVVDSLTDQDPETGEVVPWLASSWEVSPDATQFTFTLRDGATFSDGTPVDAAAVKANFDTAPQLGARAGLATSYLSGYVGTEVLDPQTARVSFAEPNAQFLQATATHSLGLVSVASTELGADERCLGVVGSGPFTLHDYERDSTITLAKREGYDWGSELFQHEGEAYLDELVFQVVPESGVRTGSLQSGQVDVIASIGPQDEDLLTASGVSLQARPNPGISFNLGLNSSDPLLADPAVRRAVSLAIDRQQVVDTALTSQSQPATSILSSSTPYYTDLSEDLAFDPEASAQLLEDAGWVLGEDGVHAKDGERLSFTVTWANILATNKPVLELLQQQLGDAGIELAVVERPIADFNGIQTSGDFDALWLNLTRADPDLLRLQFSTELANNYRLPTTELDQVLQQQAATTDPAERAELVARAQQLIVDNAYVVPVVELTTVLGVAPDVHDLAFDASSRIQLYDTWKG